MRQSCCMADVVLLPVLAAVVAVVAVPAAAAERGEIVFNRDIRPLLSDNCFACHGNDAENRQADLRLDQREAAIDYGAIVPGKPDESTLVERINETDPEVVMPPPEAHKTLSAADKQLLRRWIAEGGEYQKHWAYEPPVRPEVPPGENGIDFLIRKRLRSIGLDPSPEADRRTLIRRLSFDLIGLPPSPEEVADFINDTSPDAYERVVERLLASPHYGERMAIGWLDVVRFADTIGYHSDNPRNVWPYRDWVIESFNANKPFDRFTIEQIAGDLLGDADDQTRVASCFNRLTLKTEEGGAQQKDYESRMLTDRVRAIGAVWLGQTTGCAQCHDHKFDPITMRDFYSLGAFFADIEESVLGRGEQGMLLAGPEQRASLEKLDAAIAAARAASQAISELPGAGGPEAEIAKARKATEAALKQAEQARKAYVESLPKCLVTTHTDNKRTVRILPRGDWMDESGEVVAPALPAYLVEGVEGVPQPSEGRELTRLDLAEWLVSPHNPLTARVVTNRLWRQFFGSGLSRVLDDLGGQGEPPRNPELLDWLACEFVDSGWDIKHMVRTIVTSHTYRQTSVARPQLAQADPANRELARQSAWRLEAELVRDTALATSGLLSEAIGGPSVKPYQPAGYWENLNFPKRTYQADSGERLYRRGLYTWWQRTFLHPSLLAFDAPSREECCAERTESNIPQQALVLLNDPIYVEAARLLAARILTECDGSVEERIAWVWGEVLQRKPRVEELETLVPLFEQHLAAYRADTAAAAQLLAIGESQSPAGLEPAELAAWTHVARVAINLHETITRP